ncbi:metallophosphoesterase [Calothrix sp. UHCC 0171]|uniref:metallophosphoesterase n=1 Tax=Calothrix sp. UHCC 0171 TaxID=3110245 RepID=UPI002B1FB353|nr:metallophosphoesterase [Calothrix sp. UHCC 0171]MEA5572738.1 metallophosphoesterase [Calothrix sp. UHCC 0171]
MKKLKKTRKSKYLPVKLGLLIISLCVLFYAYFIEPNWIEVNSLQLTLPHLAREFDEYKIVQISDIHVNKWMAQARLHRIFRLVNQQKPDLIAITGDFITRHQERFIPNLEATMGELKAKDGKFGVLGNHDYWADASLVSQAMAQTNVVNLANSFQTIQRGDGKLYIAGVDDIYVGKDRLDLVLQSLPEDDNATILLAHEPDFADITATKNRFDLQLSGHSHSGQIRIPFLPPLYLPQLGKKYYAGMYQLESMLLYTNRGIGMTGLHLRFNCRPEITVITLNVKK